MMHAEEEPLISEDASPRFSMSNNSVNHNPDIAIITSTHQIMTKGRALKNQLVLSASLFAFFLGFLALSNLESTLNSEKGMGTDSQAAIYASSMISALLLPELLIKSIGCKRTLILSVLCSVPYIASNYYPRFETMIPTAILLGLSAGPLTTAVAFYGNEMARRYHKATMFESLEIIVARFFSMYTCFNECTQIFGNLISYYVLRPGITPLIVNQTLENCGVNFRKNDSNVTTSKLQPPSDEQRYLLVTIYVLCGILSAVMLMFFLDAVESDVDKEQPKNRCLSVLKRVISAAKHTIKTDQLLLLPLSVYCGLEIAFYQSDFTQAFIACSWGVHHVGFVSICFGVCGALMSILVGPLVKCISQMSVIILAAIINVVTCGLLFVWEPSPETPVAYFAFAGVWGMTDAIWWSQMAALYGLMFPNDREAAFSNFFFWSFLGYFISYSYANYFTVAVKINIMLVFLIVGITLYIAGQIKIKCCSERSVYTEIGENE